MTPDLIAAAGALADVLADENRSLSALDLGAAVLRVDAKQQATDAFIAAGARSAAGLANGATIAAGAKAAMTALATRLRDLAAENRRLLERAIAVQGRVIGTIARAIPRAADTAPRYGAHGTIAATSRPLALSARA